MSKRQRKDAGSWRPETGEFLGTVCFSWEHLSHISLALVCPQKWLQIVFLSQLEVGCVCKRLVGLLLRTVSAQCASRDSGSGFVTPACVIFRDAQGPRSLGSGLTSWLRRRLSGFWVDFAHDSMYYVHNMVGWLLERWWTNWGSTKNLVYSVLWNFMQEFLHASSYNKKKKLVWQGISAPISDY